MQELLKLLNEIDMDTLTPLMNRMVELFADQLAPYATQLCEQLVNIKIYRYIIKQ